jgi:diguanylate cyclase (GGDEF)-like protein/PAS domain S-box-containing protein
MSIVPILFIISRVDIRRVATSFFAKASPPRVVLFCAGLILVYGVVFWLFHPLISQAAIVFALPVVFLFAQIYGWWGGLLSGLLVIPLNLALLLLLGDAMPAGAMAMNFWLLHSVFVVFGVLVGNLHDVREHLRAEIEVREELEQELRQSLEKNQVVARETEITQEQLQLQIAALKAAANGIVITDKAGLIQWVNPAFTQLSGYSEAEVLGQKTSVLKSGEHDKDFYKSMWETIMAGKAWQGTMVNRRKDGTYYIEEQTITPVLNKDGEISRFIAIKQDVSDRVRAQEKMEYLATHDPLTKLPNYTLFYDRLDHAIQKAKRIDAVIGVLFIDLDGFKSVNDTFGHTCGDTLLRQIAGRLQATIRESDTVARVGGDEFTLILEELDKAEHAGKVAEKLLRSMTESYIIQGEEVQIGASIGVCVYPHDGVDAATLVSNADAAMYTAKQAGKNRVEFYAE